MNSKSLIPFDESENQDELGKIRKEKFEKALRNLVTGVTPKEDFGGDLPTRPIRGGAIIEFVPGWWFDEQANALFGHYWSFEVRDKEIGKDQIWVLGRVTIKQRGMTVIERFPDGRIVETRYDPIEIVKEQFGGSDIKKLRETQAIIDIADDLKAAATDSKKKCLTAFGFASDVYGRRERLEEGAADSSQLATLYKIGGDKGMSRDDVDNYSVEKHGKKPRELELILVLGLIQELRQKEAKV